LKNTIVKSIDDRRSEIIELVRETVRIQSVNPMLEPGAAGEAELVKRLAIRAKQFGFSDVAMLGKSETRPNLVARLWGSRKRPVLMLIGHTDTKPVGADENWKVDPFSGDVIAGKIYGRGAADMKAGLVSMLMAGAVLKETGFQPRGDFAVAMTADEEFDSALGVSWLQEQRLLKADAGIVAEPSGIKKSFDHIHLAVRGSVHFEIVTYGTQMHSSLSDVPSAVNPSVKLALVLANMTKNLKLHHKRHPLYPQGPTVSLGTILKGGSAIAVIPGQASATCDIRLPPGLKPTQVKSDIKAFIDLMKSKDPKLTVRVSYFGEGEGAQISSSEPIVQALLAGSREVLGFAPPFGGYPACTDASLILKHRDRTLRFPVVPAFGPGILSVAHQPNERIAVEDVITATKIYALAAIHYLKGQ